MRHHLNVPPIDLKYERSRQVLEAASIAYALAKKTRAESWPDLADAVLAEEPTAEQEKIRQMFDTWGGYMTDEQWGIVYDSAFILPYVRAKNPPQHIAVCDTCYEWSVMTGSAPGKCQLSADCRTQSPGTLVRAPIAKWVKQTETPDAEPDEETEG